MWKRVNTNADKVKEHINKWVRLMKWRLSEKEQKRKKKKEKSGRSKK